MSVYSIIQKSQIKETHRLDGEYFQPEYLDLEQKMKQLNMPQLKDLNIRVDASAFYPSIAEYYGNSGIPFVRVADVSNLQLQENSLLFLPEKIVNQHKTLHIGLPGDIVITKGGTVGNIALLPHKYPKYALSRDIIFVKTSKLSRDKAITILLFLASRFGVFQLIRGASLQVQPHLTLPLIRNLQIPHSIFKSAVDLYLESLDKMKSSQDYYLRAERLLLKDLPMKDFLSRDKLTYTVNLSDVNLSKRIDAEHFQPKYKELEKLLVSHQAKSLYTIVSYLKRGSQPEYDDEGEIAVINSKHIGKQFINIDSLERTNVRFYESNFRSHTNYLDVVLNSTGLGTIGRASCYLEKDEAVVDNHITIIRTKPVCGSIYLAVYLNSIIGQMQTEQWLTGSSGQIEIYPENISRFLIYLPTKGKQEEIADLFIKSYEARKKSKELLEEAKRKVEEMIDSASSLQVENGNI